MIVNRYEDERCDCSWEDTRFVEMNEANEGDE